MVNGPQSANRTPRECHRLNAQRRWEISCNFLFIGNNECWSCERRFDALE
jgi:hypothetical protein